MYEHYQDVRALSKRNEMRKVEILRLNKKISELRQELSRREAIIRVLNNKPKRPEWPVGPEMVEESEI